MKKNLIKPFLLFSQACLLTPTASHACGRDFFLCDPAGLPHGGVSLVIPTFKWDQSGGENEFEFSTGFVHPLTSRLAFDGYISAADESHGWEMETVTPGFLLDMTPKREDFPVRLGLFAAYKWAVHGGEEDEEYISANQLDARNQVETRLIVERDLTEELGAVFNVLTTLHEGNVRWGYATGVRYEFRENLGTSLEAIGDFESAGKHQVFGGVWWEPKEGIVLRTGVGAGLSKRAEDFTMLTGLLFEF